MSRDVAHNLRSEGVYTIPIDPQSFANTVKYQTNSDGSIFSLAWNTKTSSHLLCSSTITLPSVWPSFHCSVYMTLIHTQERSCPLHWQGGQETFLCHRYLVTKCNGHCLHKRDHCCSTFVICFTEADIKGYLDGITTSVPMKVIVSGNCQHITGVCYK